MRFLTCLFFVVFMINAFGQEITFERITTKEGLSQNDVLAIFQDSEGFIWFGTNDGLNRYNGYDFEIFRVAKDNTNSIGDNLINGIIEDNEKNIWIGTITAGISIYNLETKRFKRIRNTTEQQNVLTGNDITSLKLLKDGSIWAGNTKGSNFISKKGDEFEVIKVDSSKSSPIPLKSRISYCFYEFADSLAWLTSNNSVYLLQRDYSNITKWKLLRQFIHPDLYDVRKVIETKGGYLFGCQSGIVFLKIDLHNIGKYEFTRLNNFNSCYADVDLNGNIWAGGSGGFNLLEFSDDSQMPYKQVARFVAGPNNFNLPNSFIRCVFVDNMGIVWIGTTGGGVCKYNPLKHRFRHYSNSTDPHSISHNKIIDIYEDKDRNVWFGTEGGGLNFLPVDQAKNYESGFARFDITTGNDQNFIYDLVDISKKDKSMFLAGAGYTSNLVTVVEDKRNGWKIEPGLIRSLNNSAMAICRDEYGFIWIATYAGGLYRMQPNAKPDEFQNFTEDNSQFTTNIFRSFLEDSKGRLWIGTADGLYRANREEKKSINPHFEIFKFNKADSQSISHNYILPIFESSTGDIWIGTLGGGLNKYIEDDGDIKAHFLRLDTRAGLPNNVIKDVVEDKDGLLWISSNKGLTRYNPVTNKMHNYDMADGLQDLEFADLSGCVLHDGEILFGGVNGFNAFYPHEIKEDTVLPKIVFSQLEVNNQKITPGNIINGKSILIKNINSTSELILKHNENNFTIHFVGIHLSSPKDNQYKYRLKGHDEAWVYTDYKSRFARYTSIREGVYWLEVMASNSDNVWVKSAKTIKIIIKPPYWRTWWFRLILFLVLIGVVLFYIYFRIRKIKALNIHLERIVDERTLEVREKNAKLNEQSDLLSTQNEELIAQAEVLNESNTQLEERQQIIEEQSEELRAQKDSLEEANATKDKFYSILAHDVKNPFNALLGYLDLLKLKHIDYDPEKRGKMIGIAHESAQLIYKLMQNLLDWSRSQRGLLPFNPEKLDIRQIIDQVVDIYNHVAAEKGIDVVLDYQITEYEIFADENMLKTIIRNLLSNAIKYTKQGDLVKIAIQQEGEGTLFLISDTGVGIPKEVIENLFRIDRHYTTQGTSEEKGTGLGLVLCKEFVQYHDGEIWVESELGVGSTFCFKIPKPKR